jgi:hypothetical protein
VAHNDKPLQTSLKTSPEVEKNISLETSLKETKLVKRYCKVGKITSVEKTSPKEQSLVKTFEHLWSREIPVPVGVFVLPSFLFKKN